MLANVISAIADALHALPAYATVPVRYWRRYLSGEDAPPRIVVVGRRDKYGPPTTVGGNPAAMAHRMAGIEVHVWAADADAVEALLHAFIQCMFRVLGANEESAAIIDGEWNVRTNVLVDGEEYILRASVGVPVVESTYDVAPPDTVLIHKTYLAPQGGSEELGCEGAG